MEYQIMFYGGLAGAIVTLIISIIVYIKLQISQVLTDITGFSFRKKTQSQSGKREGHEPKRTTSEIKLRKKEVPVAAAMEDTDLLSEEVEPTALLHRDTYLAPTALLSKDNPTFFGEDETTILSEDADETTLLMNGEDETTILSEGDGETAVLTEVEEASDFIVEIDVMIVHTNQVIEQRGVLH